MDGAVFHHTENAPVAPASDNSFQRPSADGVYSVDVARGFEDVMAQSATCSANHQNIVQGFEDGFFQDPASTLGCEGTVWGVENDLTQSTAGAFAYENIARGFEPGSIHHLKEQLNQAPALSKGTNLNKPPPDSARSGACTAYTLAVYWTLTAQMSSNTSEDGMWGNIKSMTPRL